MTESSFKDYALEYASRGWRVLPLHSISDGVCTCRKPDCSSPGKHPRNNRGLSDATSDHNQVNDWWEVWPDANIGIATGRESGVVVVDVDGQEGKRTLQELDLPESATVETGKGLHIYYTTSELPDDVVVRNSVRSLGGGIDVRGEGGYVVAPPSVHASGSQYAWVNPERIIPAPSILTAQNVTHEPTSIDGRIPSGMRNETLASIAGVLRRKGLGEEEIYVALSSVNEKRCVPRLSDGEVRGIAHSVCRYRPEDPVVLDRSYAPEIKIYTTNELRNLVLPDQDELAGPLLVRGSRLVIAGHTGEGKTTFALQLIRDAIQGGKFLRWQVEGGSRVLVIDAEQGISTIKRRLEEAGLDGEFPHFVRVPDGLSLDSDAEALLIEEVLASNRYDIVVLDPLYKLHKGELTDERVSVELMRRLDAWRERYRFGLLLLAHCRKPLQGYPFTIHDVFGSTAVLRGAEVVLGIQRVESGTSLLHFFKDRDGDLPVGEAWTLTFDRERGFVWPMAELTHHQPLPQQSGEETWIVQSDNTWTHESWDS